MQYNKINYIITSLYSIVLSAVMAIGYTIKNDWYLSFTHLLIMCCIIYICLMINSLKTEIDKLNETKPPTENIPSNYNPILENDILEV